MSQNLSVARAVFISALLRAEPSAPDVSRDDAMFFARTLSRTYNICTTSNMKLCKSFIVRNILPSGHRTAALAKYLVTLSKSFEPRDSDSKLETTKFNDENEGLGEFSSGKPQQPPDAAFKRLHILYIIHDVLCHVHVHPPKSATADRLKEQIPILSELAACSNSSLASKTLPAILELITLWERIGLSTRSAASDLREKVILTDTQDWSTVLARLNAEVDLRLREEKRQREAATKWRLPDRHGVVPHDPTAPWHELPAANGLFMQRTRGYPLRAAAFPPGGYPLPHAGREADEDLKAKVEKLHAEALRCFEKYTPADEVQDVDALGNIIWKDPERPARNFWGFTLDGVEKRRELARRFAESASGYGGVDERVNDAVERARALAAGRGRGLGRARGGYGGRGGWRGGPRW